MYFFYLRQIGADSRRLPSDFFITQKPHLRLCDEILLGGLRPLPGWTCTDWMALSGFRISAASASASAARDQSDHLHCSRDSRYNGQSNVSFLAER